MVIESRYWRDDLTQYVKKFRPVQNPSRWTERLVVDFEKDVTIALFMVRRLAEAGKFSTKFKNHRAMIFRCPFVGTPHRLIWRDISELYDLETEQKVSKGILFVCNQLIHADFTYATRSEYRNWDGLYTSSDFEKRRWLYRIPLSEIVKILELAIEDRPNRIMWRYDQETEDWIVKTD